MVLQFSGLGVSTLQMGMTDSQKDSESLCHWLPWAHMATQHCSMGGQAGGTRSLKGRGYRAGRWVCDPQSSVRSKFTLPFQVALPPSPTGSFSTVLALFSPIPQGQAGNRLPRAGGHVPPHPGPSPLCSDHKINKPHLKFSGLCSQGSSLAAGLGLYSTVSLLITLFVPPETSDGIKNRKTNNIFP